MADQLNNDGDDDIFVYTGGEQRVPRDVKRVRIADNIDTIPAYIFDSCRQLKEVEGHDKLKKIEHHALNGCFSLRWISNMRGIREIEGWAFYNCYALSELESDKLEIIHHCAFGYCKSIRSINLPSIRRVGNSAFKRCEALTDAEFGKDLERIEGRAFLHCPLRRIVIPLKDNLINQEIVVLDSDDSGSSQDYYGGTFSGCNNLSRVDIVGGIRETISSLHLESWRNKMHNRIDRINRVLSLPSTRGDAKTAAIQDWIRMVIRKMGDYKSLHKGILREAMTLLELALWKAKLLDAEDEGHSNDDNDEKKPKKVKIDTENARKQHRVTCGASIVIKNVLPFLALK